MELTLCTLVFDIRGLVVCAAQKGPLNLPDGRLAFKHSNIQTLNSYRPKIRLELKPFDKTLEFIAIILLVLLWGLFIYAYISLPERVPLHFDMEGRIDGWGNKTTILFLPVIATVIYTGLTILNRYPHIFNYPARLNEENAPGQYLLATRLIRILKFSILIVFIVILLMIIKGANDHFLKNNWWNMPLIIGLVIIPVLVYLLIAGKKNKFIGSDHR